MAKITQRIKNQSKSQALSADPKTRATKAPTQAKLNDGTTEVAGEAGAGAGDSADCATAMESTANRTATRAMKEALETAAIAVEISRVMNEEG